MAISKKGKRRIVVNSRAYLWWIFEEQDQTAFDGTQIKIVAEDQSMSLKYGLQQRDEERFIVLSLHHDAGLINVLCPKFENNSGIITPSGINELITWSSLSPGEKNIRKITHAWDRKNGILNEQQAKLVYKEILEKMNKPNAPGH